MAELPHLSKDHLLRNREHHNIPVSYNVVTYDLIPIRRGGNDVQYIGILR